MYISLLAFLEWLLSQNTDFWPIFLLFIGQVIVGLRWSQQVSLVANGPKLGGLFLGERPLSHPNLHTLIIIQCHKWPDLTYDIWHDWIWFWHNMNWILYLFEIVWTKLLWPGSSPHPPPASSWAPRLHLDHLLPHNLLLLAVTFG